MEVLFGKNNKVGECSGMFKNTQNRAVCAVTLPTGLAHIAMTAGDIDFANDILAKKPAFLRDHLSYKFMTQDALKTHVPMDDLQICVANRGIPNLDQYFTRFRHRIRDLLYG